MHISAFGCDIIQPVKGQIPGDPGQEMLQHSGNFRRNGVPCSQIRIRRDFLRILPAAQDIVGDPIYVAAVFLRRLADGCFLPGQVKRDDLGIFHQDTSS